jgi:hypothetical protein
MRLVLMRAAIWINYGSPGDHDARTRYHLVTLFKTHHCFYPPKTVDETIADLAHIRRPRRAIDDTFACLILPELRKPIWRKRSVPRRTLQVSMTKIVRQRARIMAIIGELKPSCMSQHVGMDWKR